MTMTRIIYVHLTIKCEMNNYGCYELGFTFVIDKHMHTIEDNRRLIHVEICNHQEH